MPLEWAAVTLATSVERVKEGRPAGSPPRCSQAPSASLSLWKQKHKTRKEQSAARPGLGRLGLHTALRRPPLPSPQARRPLPCPWAPLRLLPSRAPGPKRPVLPGILEEDAVMFTCPRAVQQAWGARPTPSLQLILAGGPSPPLVASTLRQHSGRGVSHQPHAGLEGAHPRACSKSCNNTYFPALHPSSHPLPREGRLGALLQRMRGVGRRPGRPLTSTSSWPRASWGSSGRAAGPAAPGTWPRGACPGSSCSTRGRRRWR